MPRRILPPDPEIVIEVSFDRKGNEIATATYSDIVYHASSERRLARRLVAAGAPDVPWRSVDPRGVRCLIGRSLHAFAANPDQYP